MTKPKTKPKRKKRDEEHEEHRPVSLKDFTDFVKELSKVPPLRSKKK